MKMRSSFLAWVLAVTAALATVVPVAFSSEDPRPVVLAGASVSMEQAVKSSNRDLKFRITGMVTEYNARNYVLLEKVVVVPENIQPF